MESRWANMGSMSDPRSGEGGHGADIAHDRTGGGIFHPIEADQRRSAWWSRGWEARGLVDPVTHAKDLRLDSEGMGWGPIRHG